MQRNFFRGLLICLCPLIVAAWFAVLGEYRKGIDLAGGTILTYEVDTLKTATRLAVGKGQAVDPDADTGKLSGDDLKKLAESIKRRIDPADLFNVVVRPVGSNRIEIILPFSDKPKKKDGDKEVITEDYVEEVKSLVAQVGVLEFRILANDVDDAEAVRSATEIINNLSSEEAAKYAKGGLPPPPPVRDGGFAVKAMSDSTVEGVQYAWVELGKVERETLGLSNAYADKPPVNEKGEQRSWLYPQLAPFRGKTYLYTSTGGDEGATRRYSMLMYSREFQKANPTPDEAKKQIEYFVLTRSSPVDALRVGGDVTLTAHPDQDPRTLKPAVAFTFNGAGASKFGTITERNRKDSNVIRNLAIILDNQVVSAPTLNSPIRERGQIAGGFTPAEVSRLVFILQSGALTAELNPVPVSTNTVGPTLGADTVKKGLVAVAGSFAAVLIFMLLYYRFAGMVACIALLANLLLTVGFMVAVNAAFTLAGLAGLVLMLGMAVDANVLIYERLREERDKGATLAAAIRNGYDRAFLTIIDTHLTSIFTSIVLYGLGNDNLKGFAISLAVGLIISLFTSLYMTRLMFDYWLSRHWLTKLSMHRLLSRTSINFMKIRYYMFGLTVFLTVAGLLLFLARGKDVLNVDFNGGTSYTATLAEPLGLTTTDGKPGLMDLLDDGRQKTVLAVKPVRDGGVTRVGEADKRTFQITYADNKTYKVTLSANPAPGAGEQAELDAVHDRAGKLPDWSVEQIDANIANGTSTKFSVRTTEKEIELVEVVLSRLLDEKLSRTTATVSPAERPGPFAVLTFSKPTSKSVVERLLTREFTDLNLNPETGGKGFDVEGTESGGDKSGESKYTAMRIGVDRNPNFKALTSAVDASRAAAVVGGFAGADPKAVNEHAQFRAALADLVRMINAQPQPESVETFDTALAEDTRSKALWAIAVSWMAILAYLWFRFGNWTFGLAAVLCLIHDLCFTLGAIAACHYVHDTWFGQILGLKDFKIDLAAVAALLTLVGYSVNEIIVNFARIREVRGKNPALTEQTINTSVNQTLSRTVLTATTVLLVSIVLYVFGGVGVHLFAFVMATGVIISTYSSIYIASPLLLMFGEGSTALREQAEQTAVEAESTPQTAL